MNSASPTPEAETKLILLSLIPIYISDFKANALDVAADFDEFRCRARDEEGMPFYAGFFATLSETIKRHHEP